MYYVNNADNAKELLVALINAGYTEYSVKGNGVVFHHEDHDFPHGISASKVMSDLGLEYNCRSMTGDECHGVIFQLNHNIQNVNLKELLVKVEKTLEF